jgi:transposase
VKSVTLAFLKLYQHIEIFEKILKIWRELSKRIAAFDKQLEAQAVTDSKLEEVYRSVPGIGKVSSRLLANELGNLLQFPNCNKLFSFTGLTPTEHSSREQVRKGHISR